MKTILLILLSFLFTSTNIFSQALDKAQMQELRKKQVENIHKPETWDMGRMSEDIEDINPLLPIRFGAFPVPDYKNLLRYAGGGFQSPYPMPAHPEYRLKLEDKEIMFSSFWVNHGPFYTCENEKSDVFFTIITVVDTLDENNFVMGSSKFISRNHPDVTAQGSFVLKNDIIEFLAFTTPDKGSYAVVNMRLFHLEYGNTIIIAPHKDGTYRSLQIKARLRSDEENYDYIKNNILKREDVIALLTADGVI